MGRVDRSQRTCNLKYDGDKPHGRITLISQASDLRRYHYVWKNYRIFRASPPKAGAQFDEQHFRRVRWQTFLAMTVAYVTFTSAGCHLPSPKARSSSWVFLLPSWA